MDDVTKELEKYITQNTEKLIAEKSKSTVKMNDTKATKLETKS